VWQLERSPEPHASRWAELRLAAVGAASRGNLRGCNSPCRPLGGPARGPSGPSAQSERNVSYATDRADLLAKVLERIATLGAYQLVGHRDNLEFWVDEVVSAIEVIDGYSVRFRKMKNAQVGWVRAHDVKVSPFCPICSGGCEFGPRPPDPPRRVPDAQMDDARKSLREAARRFLRRLYRAHMATCDEVLAAADRIGTGFEEHELDREEPPEADLPP
jgi:hypothetical protein